jgi:microcystin-dependent protein
MTIRFTPRLALPYPTSADTADVPRDIRALAERIEALTAWIRDVDIASSGVPQPGDLRFTAIAVATPTTIPGWVLCDGGSYLRAGTYATLFAAIGTSYGSVDGTHFSVPDFRGRVPAGVGQADSPNGVARALAAKFGDDSAFLSLNEIPPASAGSGYAYEANTASVGTAQSGAGQAVLTSLNQTIKTAVPGFSQTVRTSRNQPTLAVNVLIKI